MSLVRDIFLHNWHLKLFSVLIAFLLWATYTGEPAAEIGYQVPLEFRDLPPTLEISGDVPAQVYIRIRGRSALLRRLSARDFVIPLDMSDSVPGDKEIRITPDDVNAPAGVQVVRISPSTLRFQLAPRGSPAPNQ